MRKTPSPEPYGKTILEVKVPSPSVLEALKLSPEVAYYLLSRRFKLPTCPPLVKAPEPRDEEGAIFDAERVDKVLNTFLAMEHSSGSWAGTPLVMEPWQVAYVLAPVFGWVAPQEDGEYYRIVTDVLVDVSRKNGKSTLSSGVALYLATADGEAGAQVICAATDEKQAGQVFTPIRELALKSPKLRQHVKALKKKVVHKRTGSYVEVVSGTASALHGANVHGAIIDEIHLHKDGELVEALETGRGARRQPLVFMITTADSGQAHSVYSRRRERLENAAKGHVKLPSVYGAVFAASPEDDPFVEATWKKANPNYGVSITRTSMKNAAATAKTSPADYASFLRFHLGLRTKQSQKYLTLEEWDKAEDQSLTRETMAGRIAYGGLDLSSTSDFSSLCWVFPDGKDAYRALWRTWLPELKFDEVNKRTDGAAALWREKGWLELTEGNVIDYNLIERRINEDRQLFLVKELAYDTYGATALANNLQAARVPMVQVSQTYASLSSPLQEVKRTLQSGQFKHEENGLVRWAVDNLSVKMDEAGKVRPAKVSSVDRIDPVAALVDAMSRAILYRPKKSIYSKLAEAAKQAAL